MTLRIGDWNGYIGTDPEIFAFSGRKLMPAYKFLPDKNIAEYDNHYYSKQYWDGFQAEFTFRFRHSCLVMLAQDIQDSLNKILINAKKVDESAKLVIQNVVRVPQAELQTAHTQFVQLGCEPSYNVYDMQGEPVRNPRNLPWRFSGGHMHFSPFRAKFGVSKRIQKLDSILGIWAVGAAQGIDIPIRRQFYGLAGEYRLPIYKTDDYKFMKGLEYRTLSNFWLCHPRIMMLTWEIARRVMAIPINDTTWVATKDEVIKTINNCDVDHAKKILQRNSGMFMAVLPSYWNKEDKDKAFDVGLRGVELECNPQEIHKNWNLGSRSWLYRNVPTWVRYENKLF